MLCSKPFERKRFKGIINCCSFLAVNLPARQFFAYDTYGGVLKCVDDGFWTPVGRMRGWGGEGVLCSTGRWEMQLCNLSHTSGQSIGYTRLASSVVQNPYYYFCQVQGSVKIYCKIRMKKRFHPDPPSRVDYHLNKCSFFIR